jgi:hypothetical protein
MIVTRSPGLCLFVHDFLFVLSSNSVGARLRLIGTTVCTPQFPAIAVITQYVAVSRRCESAMPAGLFVHMTKESLLSSFLLPLL